jgi:predicted NBD/HSP70 family sugar kinase
MTQKADRDQIRRQNRSIVLQALRRKGPQARIDLGRVTELSPATVTSITSDLISEGLVVGVDEQAQREREKGTRGRPRSLLALRGSAASVLAVKLSVNRIELALADYGGRLLARGSTVFDSATVTADGFGRTLVAAIGAFVEEEGAGKPAVIAIAAQGVVDDSAGTVAWSPAFALRHMPVVAPLREAFGVACMLSNDTNMIAEALHRIDPLRYGGTFAVLFVDYGVGMGLFVNNRLFVGETGAAAEIGHASHIPGGALCRCGRRGCLEAYLGDYALRRHALGLDPQTPPARVPVGRDTVRELIRDAEKGDAGALDAFRAGGIALGYTFARVIATLDPRRIVVTGAASNAYPLMREAALAALEEALVADLRGDVEIEAIAWEEDLILRGTIARALHSLDTEVFAETGVSTVQMPAGG